LNGNDNSPFPWENTAPPAWLLASIPTNASLNEITEMSTRTPSREYSRGGTADLMATSDSHEKSTEFRFINRERDSDVDIVTSLSSATRIHNSGTSSTIPDPKRPNKGLVGAPDAKGFVELDISEKSKNLYLPTIVTGHRLVGQKPKKISKDSSKTVSLSKRKKHSSEQDVENGSAKCICNLL